MGLGFQTCGYLHIFTGLPAKCASRSSGHAHCVSLSTPMRLDLERPNSAG